MKAFKISALALLTSMVSAAPSPVAASSSIDRVGITFYGAADAKFTQTFTTNGVATGISQ